MLITLIVISILFLTAGIVGSRIEARIELKKRREYLRKRAYKVRNTFGRSE